MRNFRPYLSTIEREITTRGEKLRVLVPSLRALQRYSVGPFTRVFPFHLPCQYFTEYHVCYFFSLPGQKVACDDTVMRSIPLYHMQKCQLRTHYNAIVHDTVSSRGTFRPGVYGHLVLHCSKHVHMLWTSTLQTRILKCRHLFHGLIIRSDTLVHSHSFSLIIVYIALHCELRNYVLEHILYFPLSRSLPSSIPLLYTGIIKLYSPPYFPPSLPLSLPN